MLPRLRPDRPCISPYLLSAIGTRAATRSTLVVRVQESIEQPTSIADITCSGAMVFFLSFSHSSLAERAMSLMNSRSSNVERYRARSREDDQNEYVRRRDSVFGQIRGYSPTHAELKTSIVSLAQVISFVPCSASALAKISIRPVDRWSDRVMCRGDRRLVSYL